MDGHRPPSVTKRRRQPRWLRALVANRAGEILELQGYAAVGQDGPQKIPLRVEDTVAMPFGSELMFLPDRIPIVYNLRTRKLQTCPENPQRPRETVFPVAVFNSPGYVLTHFGAWEERGDKACRLPLFSYGAVGWHRNGFRSAALQVDREKRQDLRRMPAAEIKAGIQRMRAHLPDNRLRAHLETCALTYGCPAAKNFFLSRYEAPLPTARRCNARCLGCLSHQPDGGIAPSQPRIGFTPSAREIAEVALVHMQRVKRSVVSFGQGCEGDPLVAAGVIEPALRRIRSATGRGTINMNTNAGRPDILARLFEAGLDSIRVSLNSVQPDCYKAYFRPASYGFDDVLRSIDLALELGKHVSINYLNCPGFTDSTEEFEALAAFLKDRPVHMIQWRNLNFDPRRYLTQMRRVSAVGAPIGVVALLERLHEQFPHLRYGYFNPPREKWPPAVGQTPTRTRRSRR